MNRRTFIPLFGTALIGASCLSVNVDVADDLVTRGIILPKRLKRGDTIGIAAPAGPIHENSEVGKFETVLHSMGFKTQVAEHTYGQYGFLSAPDETRAKEFMELIADESVSGIFFIRGGWGCARLLPLLDFKVIKSNPKVIMA